MDKGTGLVTVMNYKSAEDMIAESKKEELMERLLPFAFDLDEAERLFFAADFYDWDAMRRAEHASPEAAVLDYIAIGTMSTASIELTIERAHSLPVYAFRRCYIYQNGRPTLSYHREFVIMLRYSAAEMVQIATKEATEWLRARES